VSNDVEADECEHTWVRPNFNPWYALRVEQVAIRCAKCWYMPGVKKAEPSKDAKP
jgi:hypothetical protein